MLRAAFDQQLAALRQEVLGLGDAAATAVARAVEALTTRDAALATAVIAADLEMRALTLIATQQPVAHDLRLLAAVIAIGGELERIGDYAKGIAKVTRRLAPGPPYPLPGDLPRLVALVLDMLRRSLAAFAADDAAAARRIWWEDDAVDVLQEQLYGELFAAMHATSGQIVPATRLLRVVHNLERIADRATNICERALYSATGDHEVSRAPNGPTAGSPDAPATGR